MSNLCQKINLYSVFTLLKYGPSEIFRYTVTEKYQFHLPTRQVLDKGLDITSSASDSKTELQKTHEVTMNSTTSNTSRASSEVGESYDKEDFKSEMEARRELKQKVCENSNKAGSILSPLMERVVYYV